jgi:hypothetical protein
MDKKMLEVYDPPMCCTTGVCGPTVDPALAKFASALDWAGKNGITIKRYSLSEKPAAFTKQAIVKAAVELEGTGCLPLLLLNGALMSKGTYPEREVLAGLLGIKVKADPNTKAAKPPKASSCCSGSGCC